MGANNHQKDIKQQEAKTKQKSAEPEIQEIQEFVVSSEKTRSEFAGLSRTQKQAVAVVLFAAAAVSFLMVGINVCGIDVKIVCAILVIQVVISALLDHSPVWLHICVAAADLIVGFCLNQVMLMAVSMVVYVVSIASLEILQRAGAHKKV